MSSINKPCLGNQIQCTIDNEDYANTGATGLFYSAFAVNTFCEDRKSFVDTKNNLPTANTLPNGQLVFLDDVKTFVVQNNGEWEAFDGRQIFPKNVGVVWGRNNVGQLGIELFARSAISPTGILTINNKWCSISAGNQHTAAVKTDSTLWTWGLNNCGQLGDGSKTNRCIPAKTIDFTLNWCQVSAGGNHTAAVKKNGTLWTWGNNAQGRLGNGTTTDRCSPGSTAGGGTNWSQVSGGDTHTAAVKTDGTLWTWGDNGSGRLGDGTTTDRCSPVITAGGGTNWCQVSISNHSSAVKTDGTLWTWGCNASGQLGDGSTTAASSPVTTAGGGTDWCQVSAGTFNTAAVKSDGTLWTWGCNGNGQLGDGSSTNRCSPVTTAGGGTDWTQVSAGSSFTTAIKTDGTLWTWGTNSLGQLGDGTTTDRCSPGTTAGGGTNWTRISSGGGHTIGTTNPV